MAECEVEVSEEVFLPVYRHLLHNNQLFDIDFLYGGRDSGKSRHIAQQLILDCLSLPYFRCPLIRKVKDTIKDSQWQLLKDVAEEWEVDNLFKFTISPLQIKCLNGNSFIARGCDQPGKLKSIANPSHCWIEEGNQISEDDFTIIMSTLRSNQGKVKTWFSFNPECEQNYQSFWLYKNWFSHTKAFSFEAKKQYMIDGRPVEYNYRSTQTTYRDNPYCSDERKALYESYATSSGYYYQVFTLGLWGYKKTGGEFWKQFKSEKHVMKLDWLPSTTVHIVLDNNVNPYVTVAIWQIRTTGTGTEMRQFDEIPCESPYNNAPKAARRTAEWLHRKLYEDIVYVYGDPSANAKSTVDENNASFFEKFIQILKDEGFMVVSRVQRSAPLVALSGSFINEIFETLIYGLSILINEVCHYSIEDYTMAKENSEGGIQKRRIVNTESGVSYEQYGHFSDAMRYFVVAICAAEFKRYKVRRRSKVLSS
jgi:phage terminase large subunit